MSEVFNLELLRAVSAWQQGGDFKQNKKRGEDLKKFVRGCQKNIKSAHYAAFDRLPCLRAVCATLLPKGF